MRRDGSTLPTPLRETLVRVEQAARAAIDPWWIISSAAVALHGVAPIEIGDVDMLMSVRDAAAMMQALGIEHGAGATSPRFRSTLFGTWRAPPLSVEIMADFHVAVAGAWQPVLLRTRMAVEVDGATLFVPERDELHALLLVFGRPKDIARAGRLRPD